MKSAKKHTFYPTEEVAIELKEVPRGQLSERVNELILKGLSAEKQNEIALAYLTYDAQLAKSAKRDLASSSSRLMSEAAFVAEDEVEDFV